MTKHKRPNIWQVLVSVLGALFGVQSRAVGERDFSRGQALWVYILVGFSVVLILVLGIVGVSKLIVHLASIH